MRVSIPDFSTARSFFVPQTCRKADVGESHRCSCQSSGCLKERSASSTRPCSRRKRSGSRPPTTASSPRPSAGSQVRGAPLIGIAAAYGLALAPPREPTRTLPRRLEQAAAELRSHAAHGREPRAGRSTAVSTSLDSADDADEIAERAHATKRERIHDEDIAGNQRMGELRRRAPRPTDARVLTHCNAGALATGGYGTALGVIRAAHASRASSRHVYATETRPLLQGARLTAWELPAGRHPFTLIADSAAGSLMRRGVHRRRRRRRRPHRRQRRRREQDRHLPARRARAGERRPVLRRGADQHHRPHRSPTGDEIPIEERSPDEVTSFRGAAHRTRGHRRRQSGVRRDAQRVRDRDHHRERRRARPYERVLRAVCATAEVAARG